MDFEYNKYFLETKFKNDSFEKKVPGFYVVNIKLILLWEAVKWGFPIEKITKFVTLVCVIN